MSSGSRGQCSTAAAIMALSEFLSQRGKSAKALEFHEYFTEFSKFNFGVCFQVVEVIEPQRRDQRIDELLQKYHKTRKNRVIVFVLYKKEASRVEAQLGKKGWKVRAAALRAVTVLCHVTGCVSETHCGCCHCECSCALCHVCGRPGTVHCKQGL